MAFLGKDSANVYLVGGVVRDRLLGIEVYDRDWVVVGATPQMMLDAGFEQVGKDFPVFLHPQTKEEYALARTERKAGKGYHGFTVFAEPSVTLQEDLIRRDLTINAMAQDEDGQIIDPYNGQADLEKRLLRHVSAAFSEDPLRVLRVARFAAKLSPFGFQLADETRQLMSEMTSAGELEALTPERVWQEVVKVLNSAEPSLFFKVLDEVGALQVLFPELDALHGVTQPEKHHPEGDVWIHTMMVLDAACKLTSDVSVRFAALVHDLGKGITPQELWPKHHGHEAAGVPLVKVLCKRYKIPKKVEQFALKVTEYHGVIHKGVDSQGLPYLKPKTYLKVLKACSALKDPQGFDKILLACEADAKGRLGFEETPYLPALLWRAVLHAANQVDNREILSRGLQGAAVGAAIEAAQKEKIAECLANFKVIA
ncbi:multifunctional CCA addition/repair protein [Thiomicrorhabdus heinhorstiae]|uniref:Multifunctional CCA protein n=1 Tax=Thiomicrorhabdus heinhorstiae TaxID=2748010 RepID=A0ABS0BWN3_9GAMM|nr:multifunctional CCA addition/repair protein [Thiomicrorhabdus heinhorstiae]MBF6058180.1 multifunctional CCA addition/repair protein [Thiomicrorhabdus heinhorstiae]